MIFKYSGEYHITIDKNIPPVIHAVRKIPYAVLPRLKHELERVLKMVVIIPVDGPSKWVSSVVVTENPNNKLRLCLSPSDLNKAI